MINFDLIESMFNKLSPENQEHLLLILFNGKHDIGYLKKMGDISFDQLETLA